jgi:hypothetical protein
MAQQTRTANDRVYTDVRATRERTLYREKCITCHGDALEGKLASACGCAFLGV